MITMLCGQYCSLAVRINTAIAGVIFPTKGFDVVSPDVLVFVCANCTPIASKLPRQWLTDNSTVQLKEFPCSGKVDGLYMMRALEGGARGICLVTCPEGECRLAEGNLRADVRIKTTKRLMEEIGLESDRLELLSYNGNGTSPEILSKLVQDAVTRLSAKPVSPLLSK
jgi:coenzyme F420-reducing hydrogenase delta subunit